MAIFAILMPSPQPLLVETIKNKFPREHLSLSDTQWLISTTGTIIELTAKLGVYDANEPTKPPTGIAIIFAVSSYFGLAPATVWDWLKVKLEALPNA
jgi:hypothetical protein